MTQQRPTMSYSFPTKALFITLTVAILSYSAFVHLAVGNNKSEVFMTQRQGELNQSLQAPKTKPAGILKKVNTHDKQVQLTIQRQRELNQSLQAPQTKPAGILKKFNTHDKQVPLTIQRQRERNQLLQLRIQNHQNHLDSPTCTSSEFLAAVEHGKWVPRTPGRAEVEEVTSFLHDVRTDFFKMPPTLQRPDGKCGGKYNFPSAVSPFQAVCDPDGASPCCYANTHTCVNKSESECMCTGCVDMRTRVHANFASWKLDDPKCEISLWNDRKSVCDLLKGLTIRVIGDSLLQHIYLSLMAAVRGGGAIWSPGVPESTKHKCRGERLFPNNCRVHALVASADECARTVTIKYEGYWKANMAWRNGVKDLIGKPNTVLVIGIGLHDNLNFPLVRDKMIVPLMEMRGNSTWPVIVWFTPHLPGLLKSKQYVGQTREKVLIFNDQVKTLLKGKLPVVNTAPLTEGIVSYDGTHHSKAVNDVKARILLSLLDKVKKAGWKVDSYH